MTQPTLIPGTSPRTADLTRCRDCGQIVQRGLSDDRCAFTVEVDPTPVSVLGEALALIQGRTTYELRRHGQQFRLYRRDQWQIRGRPPGTPGLIRADTLAEHRCGSDPLPATASVHTKTVKEAHDDQACPF